MKHHIDVLQVCNPTVAWQVQRDAQGAAEGRHINKSLLALGTVIAGLSSSAAGHVTFRDSVLTRLLQASLTGERLGV